MLLRSGKWVVVLALMISIGAHWAILQSVAWTTMLMANLSTDSVCVAVARTFDGHHPCALCKKIEAAKKSEQKSDSPALSLKKWDCITSSGGFVFSPPVAFRLRPSSTAALDSLPATPPSPPPRTLSV